MIHINKLIMRSQIQERVIELVRSFLNTNLKNWTVLTNPSPLISVKRKAVRMGIWWRMQPLKRALLDATIMFLRRGGVVRAVRLINMIKEIVQELLTYILSRKVVFVAYLVGKELVRRFREYLGIVNDVKYIIHLGIQWLNIPLIYRGPW